MNNQMVIKACLLSIINAALRFQGILDVVAFGLSDDFNTALVCHIHDGRVIAIGAVPTATLLIKD